MKAIYAAAILFYSCGLIGSAGLATSALLAKHDRDQIKLAAQDVLNTPNLTILAQNK